MREKKGFGIWYQPWVLDTLSARYNLPVLVMCKEAIYKWMKQWRPGAFSRSMREGKLPLCMTDSSAHQRARAGQHKLLNMNIQNTHNQLNTCNCHIVICVSTP